MCEKKRFVFNGGYVFLQESNAMTERFFEVCDITTTNPGLVSNDDFLKRMMANAEVDSDWTNDDNDMLKGLFEKWKLRQSTFCLILIFNVC